MIEKIVSFALAKGYDQSDEGEYMNLALSIILVVSSILMIVLVLLHKGKGSGLSDLFGGGISSTYGGSSVVEKNLDRITIVVGGVWFASVVALSLLLKN